MKKAKKTVKDVGWGPMIATHGEPPAKRNRSSATSAQRWRSTCSNRWDWLYDSVDADRITADHRHADSDRLDDYGSHLLGAW